MGNTRRRVVQWTTGGVARQAVAAVLDRPDLELVGVYAYSPSKVGKDAADLCGLPETTGIVATDDVDALLALRPDCVVYTPLHFDADEVTRLLRAGVNVVTSCEFLTGRAFGEEVRAQLQQAALDGGASLFGSGVNPGFVQLLAVIAAGISLDVRQVTVYESVDVSLFADDANMDELGWGRPLGDPGHPEDVQRATAVFADAVEVAAGLLGVPPDQVEARCTVELAAATKDLDLPGRPIAEGGVAGIDVRWEGLVAGRPCVELHQRWVMGSDIEPPWTVEHAYLVEIDGDPQIRLRLELWPDQDLATLTTEDMHGIGMRVTALPVVNAIPAVCDAAPGIRTYADLPLVTPRLTST